MASTKKTKALWAIEGKGLSYRYGQHYALYEVDIFAKAGSPCVVDGPNGSGKTTLLEILALTRNPQKGQVLFIDKEKNSLPLSSVHPQLAILGDETLCHGELTARENVAHFCKLWGRKTINERTDQSLDALGLDQKDPRIVSQMSRGNHRRVDLAVVLALNTSALFLDEPFARLDALGRKLLLGWLHEKSQRDLVFVSTHDQSIIKELGAQRISLDSGRLVDPLDDQNPSEGKTERGLDP